MNPDPDILPPRLATRLLTWLIRDQLAEEVLGDLEEKFFTVAERKSLLRAKLNYWYQVIHYIRPFAIRKPNSHALKIFDMYRNDLKIGLRRLKRNKVYSFLNIGGLSVGLAVVMLIGLWIYEEVTFDHAHSHYDKIARVMQFKTRNGQKITARPLPFPLGNELRESYGDNFKYVVMSSWTWSHVLGQKTETIMREGAFMETDAPRLLALNMLQGDDEGLKEQNTILLSKSAADALFKNEDPLGKSVKIDNELDVYVTGVYEDFPGNSSFRGLDFIAPWTLYVSSSEWVQESQTEWDNNAFTAIVQIADGVTMKEVNERINPAILQNLPEGSKSAQNEVFLHAMSDWHLRTNWVNGVQTGGPIQYVWLFGGIGLFVLALACINFMNLSTAQSLKRSREVGIRKAIGSLKKQLVNQFLTESFLLVIFSFGLALILAWVCLPYFERLAGKALSIPFHEPWLWIGGLLVVVITSLLAGSYPSFYLSGFQVIKALKGSILHSGTSTNLRKGLVVVQFAISVILIIGTLAIGEQIEYSQNRPMGYEAKNLISVDMVSADYYGKFDLLDAQLKDMRAIESMTMTSSPMTTINSTMGGFVWEGKDPDFQAHMAVIWASPDYGKTVGWEIVSGRDFSRDLVTDNSSFVINEAALKYLNIEAPIGKSITMGDDGTFKIIGVVKNIVQESPYGEVRPTVYLMDSSERELEYFLLKLNPDLSAQEAITSVEKAFTEMAPDIPFDYEFVDQAYAWKFERERQVTELSGVFAILAILISCLGLFGLASYMAEQRTKEIGIRKVLGATVLNLWHLLSREFMLLVIIAGVIATPIAYYFLNDWLSNYQYRIEMKWYPFAMAIGGALLITLVTVSYQSFKAATANPVKSLRTE